MNKITQDRLNRYAREGLYNELQSRVRSCGWNTETRNTLEELLILVDTVLKEVK